MAENRRGYAVLITAGDPGISGALADGIRAARLPRAEPLEAEQIRTVKAEIDIQKAADCLRVAMHREPVDYAGLTFDAEMAYGESLYNPGPLREIGKKLLVAYAIVVLAFERLFERVGT